MTDAPQTETVWEHGPHANVWNGCDVRCREVPLVHWFGEPGQGPSTLHGNGPAHLGRGSGDEDEVTCRLCLTLLARLDRCPNGCGDHCGNPLWTREQDDARIERLRPLADHLRRGHDVPDDQRRYRDTWLHIALLAEEYFAAAPTCPPVLHAPEAGR